MQEQILQLVDLHLHLSIVDSWNPEPFRQTISGSRLSGRQETGPMRPSGSMIRPASCESINRFNLEFVS